MSVALRMNNELLMINDTRP